MRYKITLSYDGTGFCGWQSQPNGESVQDSVEQAVYKLFGECSRVVGSGRTDAGVHALGQVAHFDCEKLLPLKNVTGGLNAYLPRAVRVVDAELADARFDARKSAKQKTYLYLMYAGAALPVLNDRVLFLPEMPNMQKLEAQAKKLIGTHDFATFMAAGGGAKTSVRTVYDARFEQNGRFMRFYITANGFLYNMVRIIVAQLLKSERGEADIAELLEKRDRSFAKELAPACGLYLHDVVYGGGNE